MQKIKHYLRNENKVKENKVLSYYEALRYMWNNKKVDFHYVKITNLPSVSTLFPKSEPIYRRKVVNPQHQTP